MAPTQRSMDAAAIYVRDWLTDPTHLTATVDLAGRLDRAREEGRRAGIEAAAVACDTAYTECRIGSLFNAGFIAATEFCARRIRALLEGGGHAR